MWEPAFYSPNNYGERKVLPDFVISLIAIVQFMYNLLRLAKNDI